MGNYELSDAEGRLLRWVLQNELVRLLRDYPTGFEQETKTAYRLYRDHLKGHDSYFTPSELESLHAQAVKEAVKNG